MMGANTNRRTVANVRRSQLHVEQVEEMGTAGIFKLTVARRRE